MYLQAGSILQKIDYQLFKMKPQKIVIAIDSFKGCLTSAEAGEAAAQGVHAACPECRTIVLPVADGGEGMLDVLLAASNGKRITVRAHDPLMQPCDASYGISGDGNTAFIEMAAISGLPLVPADKRSDENHHLRNGRTDTRCPGTGMPPFHHRTWRERHERCRSGNAASIGIPFLR